MHTESQNPGPKYGIGVLAMDLTESELLQRLERFIENAFSEGCEREGGRNYSGQWLEFAFDPTVRSGIVFKTYSFLGMRSRREDVQSGLEYFCVMAVATVGCVPCVRRTIPHESLSAGPQRQKQVPNGCSIWYEIGEVPSAK